MSARIPDDRPVTSDGEFWANSVPEGWRPLLAETLRRMMAADPTVKIDDVKEKYGTLRIHFVAEEYESVERIVEAAEERSAKLCIRCGNPGTMRNFGWISPYCDPCDEQKRSGKR